MAAMPKVYQPPRRVIQGGVNAESQARWTPKLVPLLAGEGAVATREVARFLVASNQATA
jgi:hypothetical protein